MQPNAVRLPTELLRDFRAGWRGFLITAVLGRLAAFVVLWPLAGVALRLVVSFSGADAVADQDILFFLLTPAGFVGVSVVAAFGLAIISVEQAGLVALAGARRRGGPVSVRRALKSGWRLLPALVGVSLRMGLRLLNVAGPFLLAAGAVYLLLLRQYDINYYLDQRPPAFWGAAVILGLLGTGLAVVVVPRLAGWCLVLPLLLFEKASPAEVLSRSAGRTADCRRAIVRTFLFWAVAMAVLGGVNLAVCGALGRLLVPLAGDSLALVLPLVGGLVLLWVGGNLVVSVFQATTFALLQDYWFRQLGRPSEVPPEAVEGGGEMASEDGPLRAPWRRLAAGGVILLLVSALVGGWLLEGVQTEDHALVIAHRGASASAPENTLAAVARAIADRTDLVEIDVQETADGEVVVFHDSDFMKIAGVNLKLWNATWAQLQEIDIGSSFALEFRGERVPRLADVLALCKDQVRVDIELKYYGHDQRLEERVAAIVEAAGMERQVIVMSLKHTAVRKMKALRPEWTVGLLAATAVGDLTRLEADFLAVNTGLASRSFIERAHRRGREVYVWTVNDPLQMSRLLSMGVDGLITDRPALARAVLEHRATLGCAERLLLNLAFWLDAIPDDLVREPVEANQEA
ncbi:MAG: glycerophosphodiester phosphodiesterase [Verrucomicrobiales bacterium]|nr:glycerophosphodiester phosphodiesterase [Verrucomicrobiales bacterium]